MDKQDKSEVWTVDYAVKINITSIEADVIPTLFIQVETATAPAFSA
jgi:hypothetical protein